MAGIGFLIYFSESVGMYNVALKEMEMIRGIDNVNINEFDVEWLIGRIRGLKRR